MKITFLSSCREDLRWFRTYYAKVFPEGARRAASQYLKTLALLNSSPYIGHPLGGTKLRSLVIPRSPFAFVCRVRQDEIEIIRVLDQRSKAPEDWT